jgi:hypothetical protein
MSKSSSKNNKDFRNHEKEYMQCSELGKDERVLEVVVVYVSVAILTSVSVANYIVLDGRMIDE